MKYLRIIFFMFLTIYCEAQDLEEEYVSRLVVPEIGFSYTSPVQVFKQNNPNKGYGVEGGIFFQLNPSHPYMIGIQSFYNAYGANTESFSEEINGIPTDLNESAISHLVTVLGSVRYYPTVPLGDIKIYGELSFGPKIFFTSVRVIDQDGGDFVNEFRFDNSDVSLSYGAAFGIQVPVYTYFYLNAKVGYLPGVSATYDAKKEIYDATDFALDAFNRKNSSTNLVNYTLGLSVFL